MKLPGYWIYKNSGKASLVKSKFDVTDLDPATDWKEAWQNQDPLAPAVGFVRLDAALFSAARWLASVKGVVLQASEIEQARLFSPEWRDDGVCEIQSLTHLLKKPITPDLVRGE